MEDPSENLEESKQTKDIKIIEKMWLNVFNNDVKFLKIIR